MGVELGLLVGCLDGFDEGCAVGNDLGRLLGCDEGLELGC